MGGHGSKFAIDDPAGQALLCQAMEAHGVGAALPGTDATDGLMPQGRTRCS